jgi:ferritin-like metal-binding protein YciE
MGEVYVAFISVFGTIVVSLIGVFVAKKYNIGPNQDKLVQTLKDIVAAQDRKIAELQKLIEDNMIQIHELTAQVEELRELTVHQALLINDLQDRPTGRAKVIRDDKL